MQQRRADVLSLAEGVWRAEARPSEAAQAVGGGAFRGEAGFAGCVAQGNF